jgi:hypothetical protein
MGLMMEKADKYVRDEFEPLADYLIEKYQKI